VFQIKAVEDVATKTGLGRKLNKKGWEEVSTVLLIKILKVKIKVRERSYASFAERHDVLNDCGAMEERELVEA